MPLQFTINNWNSEIRHSILFLLLWYSHSAPCPFLKANILQRRFSRYVRKAWTLVHNLLLIWPIYDWISFKLVRVKYLFNLCMSLLLRSLPLSILILIFIFSYLLPLLSWLQPSLHCFYPYRKGRQTILKAWCLFYAIL
jgi:hypothetical protein